MPTKSLVDSIFARIRRPLGHSAKALPATAAGSRGFTLLELLVVLMILAIIGLIAVPIVFNQLSKAQTQAARVQVDQLGTILDLYRLDVGRYPTEAEGLEALLTQPPGVDRWSGPYMKKKESVIDPWGNPYIYRSPGERGDYDLYSLGADGADGGEDENADITSW